MSVLNLKIIFLKFRREISFTYFLFTIEFTLYLLGPYVIGIAIDDLLKKSYHGIYLFIAQHMGYLIISRSRRFYDTRIFTKMYNELATTIVRLQREANLDKSIIIARASLARDLINFFERDITTVFNSVYAIAGSLVILFFYDYKLMLFCICLIIPCSILNYHLNRKYRTYYQMRNSEFEKQVDILEFQPLEKVHEHFKKLSISDIKISDIGSINFTIMEMFILVLMITSLVQYCGSHPDSSSGTILAVFQYIIRFVMGLDNVPLINNQLANIKDIQRRIQSFSHT